MGLSSRRVARIASNLPAPRIPVCTVYPRSRLEGSRSGDGRDHLEANRWNLEATMNTYSIILERANDGGWSAFAPDLPGLVLAADTREQLLAGAPAAIADHLDALRDEHLPVPEPGEVELIRVAV